ncbi:MAG: choice-of-anchor D domain-containing protein [Candidatus Krumholzibacteriia bacterium]
MFAISCRRSALRPTALALLSVLSPCLPALSQDQVGIYFDQAYTQNEFLVETMPALVTGYLVLIEPSAAAGVGGWELCADIDGPAEFFNWALEGQTINADQPPCFTVGIGGPPLPGGSAVLLATFQMVVTEYLPVSLSLKPKFFASIPGSMAYLDGADPEIVIPMTTVTGVPEVAFVNSSIPVPDVSVRSLNFTDTPIGLPVTKQVVVSNVGGGFLLLDVALQAGCTDFSLPGLSGPVQVPGGSSRTIDVTFDPQGYDLIECQLDLGEGVTPVFLAGQGRDPIINHYVYPASYDFGETTLNSTRYKTISLYNLGELPVTVPVALADGNGPFSFVISPNPVVLDPDRSRAFTVYFNPTAVGAFADTLLFGGVMAPVPLAGTGRAPVESYAITPTSVVFSDLDPGESRSAYVRITNDGDFVLNLDPVLIPGGSEWVITSGDIARLLYPSQSHTVTVVFSGSPEPGSFEASLVFGAGIDPVPLRAFIPAPYLACSVTPDGGLLGMGTTGLGQDLYANIQVTNSGNASFTVVPSLDGCEYFSVNTTPFTLGPQESRSIPVHFQADAVGSWDCAVDLGLSICGGVYLTATVDADIDPDGVFAGVFFDPAFTQDHISTSTTGETVTGYLVLKNAQNTSGVAGWECCLDVVGDAVFTDWTLEGLTINVQDPPCFLVGVGGSPLPYSPAILLATFELEVPTPYTESTILLGPIYHASIPGSSAWIAWDNLEILYPMQQPTGGFIPVGHINPSIVGIEYPAPRATVAGGRVELSWEIEGTTEVLCHVYRRADGEPEVRLTDEPLAAAGGSFSFSDQATGYPEGAVLHYSYAVLAAEGEQERSPEITVRLSGVPTLRTRLLPNVPNPFNPRTEIRFEAREPGRARITIYDVSGRLVRTLVDQVVTAGPHMEVWQGRDDTGRPVPSGAYYVRMEMNGRLDHRKVLLLK